MSRRITKLAAVYLLLGLAATWAVAWGAQEFTTQPSQHTVVYSSRKPGYDYVRCPGPEILRSDGVAATWWIIFRCPSSDNESAIIEEHVPRWTEMWPRDWNAADLDFREVAGFGWPLRVAATNVPMTGAVRGMGRLRPIWGNLLANAVVLAVAIAATQRLPRQARRWWRQHRGRCVICGYDLTGIDGMCPECGREP